jgi:PAS domain S-box-containing protein
VSGRRVYRRGDLEALRANQRRGAAARSLTPELDWAEIGATEHLVQFYESDRYLIQSVCGYLAMALARGDGVLLVARRRYLQRIHRKLKQCGHDLAAARRLGQCVSMDASRTLSRLMVGQTPDWGKFDHLVGSAVQRLAQRWPQVRIFGEMVSLLWTAGNREGACQLEKFWNDLAKRHTFSLFCAYRLDGFQDELAGEWFGAVCDSHSRVIPAESYTGLASQTEQLRTIAELQREALHLARETAHHQQSDRDRAMLAAIIESSQDAIISMTLDGIILTWNVGAEKLFGYSESEAVNQPITLIVPPARIDEEQEILRRLKCGQRIEHYETVRVAKDGRKIDISLTISPLRDAHGRLIGASKIARDITDRKRSAAAVRESEDRYRRLAELLPVGVYTCEAPSGVITYFNKHAVQLWGRTPGVRNSQERFCGSFRMYLPDGTLIPHEQCPAAISLREGREFRHEEVVLERPDGSRITALVNITPIRDASGRIAGVVNAFQDISAIKQAEQALVEADRRKDQFLATLAHELRNPLAPLSNGIDLLRLIGATQPVAKEVRQIHEMIDRQVTHMVRLIDDLLEFSRISRGKIQLKRKPVELRAIIEHARETSQPCIEAGGHALELRLPSESIIVNGDVDRLSQIFCNLLNNAAKYTDRGGSISVVAERVGGEAVVAVRDTGIGIPREMLASVFDLFAQVDNPLRQNQDGLGIGLSLVQSLVTMHGGTVEARSDGLGQGSEFVVRLPIVDGGRPGVKSAPRSRAPQVGDSPALPVLVVDDNRDAADSLGRLLRCLGSDVQVVYDGPAALAAIVARRSTLIFMDLGMPGMSGYELAREIRQNPDNKDIVLVALTGWGQAEDRRRSLEAGVDHHLVKPVDVDVLEAILVACGTKQPSRA